MLKPFLFRILFPYVGSAQLFILFFHFNPFFLRMFPFHSPENGNKPTFFRSLEGAYEGTLARNELNLFEASETFV